MFTEMPARVNRFAAIAVAVGHQDAEELPTRCPATSLGHRRSFRHDVCLSLVCGHSFARAVVVTTTTTITVMCVGTSTTSAVEKHNEIFPHHSPLNEIGNRRRKRQPFIFFFVIRAHEKLLCGPRARVRFYRYCYYYYIFFLPSTAVEILFC